MNDLFNDELRKLPKAVAEVAFYISQGLSDKEICKRRGTAMRTTAAQIEKLKDRTGFDGNRLNLMLAIRKAIG